MYDPRDYGEGSIIIHSFEGNASDNLASFKIIESKFASHNSGFERIVKVTEFFRKTFYSLCYVNPAERKVVIFVDPVSYTHLDVYKRQVQSRLP